MSDSHHSRRLPGAARAPGSRSAPSPPQRSPRLPRYALRVPSAACATRGRRGRDRHLATRLWASPPEKARQVGHPRTSRRWTPPRTALPRPIPPTRPCQPEHPRRRAPPQPRTDPRRRPGTPVASARTSGLAPRSRGHTRGRGSSRGDTRPPAACARIGIAERSWLEPTAGVPRDAPMGVDGWVHRWVPIPYSDPTRAAGHSSWHSRP